MLGKLYYTLETTIKIHAFLSH